MPIEVELPGGQIVEFPDGTDNATMEHALRAYHAQPSAPKADFSDVQSTVSSVPASAPATAPKSEPQRTLLDEAGRSAGLGGRALIRGVGDVVGIVADPFIHAVNWLGEKEPTTNSLITGVPERRWERQATMREGADHLSDVLGLPQPETPVERVSGGVTSALAGGAGLISFGRNLATRAPGIVQAIGEGLASQPGAQLVAATTGSGASEVTREMGGGPGAQATAGLVGAVLPGASKAAGQESLRLLLRGGEKGRQQTARTIADFGATGATPSVGQATGNRLLQGGENLLAGGPTSAGVMGRFAERQAQSIGEGLQDTADSFSRNASAERAGRAIEQGVEQFGKNAGATKRALYWQADRFIPEKTPVPLPNTWQTAVTLTTPTPGAMATTGTLVHPRISQLRQALERDITAGGGQIPYSALKRIRTDIGEQLNDFSLSPDTPTRELSQLYAALSRDMEAAAQSQGPQAAQAARRANNYTRAVAARLESIQRVVDKNGGPERVFAAAMSGTRDGGTTLRSVMQSLPPEGQRAVTAAVIKRMGLANPGQQGAEGAEFSAQTFLTNWNKVSPEARRALFDRHGPKFTANMDRIARVAENIRNGSRVYANPSGTANRMAAGAYLLSLAGAVGTAQFGTLGGLAGGGVATNLLARGLTNPKFVAWLATTTALPVQAVPQAILQLKRDAERSGDEELGELAQGLQDAATSVRNPSPANGAGAAR